MTIYYNFKKPLHNFQLEYDPYTKAYRTPNRKLAMLIKILNNNRCGFERDDNYYFNTKSNIATWIEWFTVIVGKSVFQPSPHVYNFFHTSHIGTPVSWLDD